MTDEMGKHFLLCPEANLFAKDAADRFGPRVPRMKPIFSNVGDSSAEILCEYTKCSISLDLINSSIRV